MWQYNNTVPSGELYHWKYISKERVNGKWVYKYREESPSNTGLEIRKNTGMEMETNAAVNAPGMKESVRIHNTSYYLRDRNKEYREVDKDTYDKHHGTHLYYNNKLVSDIAKETITSGMTFVKKQSQKLGNAVNETTLRGKMFVQNLFKKKNK